MKEDLKPVEELAGGTIEVGRVVEESGSSAPEPPPKPKAVPHPTRAERAARGRAARAEVSRSGQGEIDFPKRRDPVALLEEQAATRVPELVPIRYGRIWRRRLRSTAGAR